MLVMLVVIDVFWFELVIMVFVDFILGVLEVFKKDNSEKKLNLGVGVYWIEDF